MPFGGGHGGFGGPFGGHGFGGSALAASVSVVLAGVTGSVGLAAGSTWPEARMPERA